MWLNGRALGSIPSTKPDKTRHTVSRAAVACGCTQPGPVACENSRPGTDGEGHRGAAAHATHTCRRARWDPQRRTHTGQAEPHSDHSLPRRSPLAQAIPSTSPSFHSDTDRTLALTDMVADLSKLSPGPSPLLPPGPAALLPIAGGEHAACPQQSCWSGDPSILLIRRELREGPDT